MRHLNLSKIISTAVLVITFCTAAVAWWVIRESSRKGIPLKNGEIVPYFEALDSNLSSFTRDEMLGRKYLLAFLSIDCGLCQKEIPDLIRILSEFSPKNLTAMGISLSSPQETHDFFANLDTKMAYVVDSNRELRSKFKVVQVPSFFLVDENGRLHRRFTGRKSPEFYVKVLKEFVKPKPRMTENSTEEIRE